VKISNNLPTEWLVSPPFAVLHSLKVVEINADWADYADLFVGIDHA
jgi:hypothetical protein